MKHYLWTLRPYFRQVAGQLVLGSLAGIVMNTAVVLPAILLGRTIDTVLAFARDEADASAVGRAALLYVGGVLLTEGPRVLKRWWLMTANARIRSNIRADALRGVLAWPMAHLHRTPIGDVMARIIGDVEVLGVGVREFIIETWDTLLFSVSLIVAMLLYDAGLTTLVLLPVPFALLLSGASGRWVKERTTAARAVNARLTAMLQEQLVGLRVLRLFGRGDAAVEQVARLSGEQAEANLATLRLRGGLQPVYSILISAGIVLLIWQGGTRVVTGVMTVGSFVAYLELYLRFINRGFRIPQLVNSIQSGGAAYMRIAPLLAPPLSARQEPRWSSFRGGHIAGIAQTRAVPATAIFGPTAVTLEEVTFSYPDALRPALRDVSLTIPAGALVGVTGPVGAGKSALARVLLGLYHLECGRVLLDGQPIEAYAAEERAARIGYLSQQPYLFSGSVRDNVMLGRVPKSNGTWPQPGDTKSSGSVDHTLADALARAVLDDDLRTFPAGAETEIGELGMRVSGGQRQRIALARAIVAGAERAPGLLVLDDPFASVDVDTEARIIAGLRDAFGPAAPPGQRATIVLCSHRLAAFSQADTVVVLKEGRIVEQGRHAELVASGALYARIYQAQCRVEQPAARLELS